MMKRSWWIGVFLLSMCFSNGVMAQDVLVNGRFELGTDYAPYWNVSGNSTLHEIVQYDVTGSGESWAWKTSAWNDGTAYDNTLSQMIAVEGGITYEVSANFCYFNC